MTKTEIVRAVCEEVPELTREAGGAIVDAVLETIRKGIVKDKNVYLRGFGRFHAVRRKKRKARNPHTGEEVAVPAKWVPVFKPSRQMKEEVKEKVR